MAAPIIPLGLEGFNKIAHSVFFYRPQEHSKEATTSGTPSLVVLCAWMGANPKHVSKYTTGYKKVYPSAAILLILSSQLDCFLGDWWQTPRMRSACEIISSLKRQDPAARVILHAMSNGGGMAATRLAALGKKNLFDKVILDCLPGVYDLEQFTMAVSIGLFTSRPAKLIGPPPIRAAIGVLHFFLCTILGLEDVLDKLRRRLNDTKLFDTSAERLYLYSKADKLIHAEFVREHAQEAKEKGYYVEEIVYEDANHCALLMEESEKYFAAIKGFFVEGKEMRIK